MSTRGEGAMAPPKAVNLTQFKKYISYENNWRGGRVVEGAGLENRYTSNGIASSNLALSVFYVALTGKI